MKLKGRFILFEGISGSGKTTVSKNAVAFLESHGVRVLWNTEPTKKNAFGRTIRAVIEGQELSYSALIDLGATIAELDVQFGALSIGVSKPEREIRLDFCRSLGTIQDKLLRGKELSELERQTLFLADRVIDIYDTIIPALQKGTWVVQDRFDLSSFAYGGAHGVSQSELLKLHRAVLRDAWLLPDLTIFVAVTPEEAVERLKRSGKPLDLHERLESLKRIRKEYTHALAMQKMTTTELHRIDPSYPIANTRVVDGMPSEDVVVSAVTSILAKMLPR